MYICKVTKTYVGVCECVHANVHAYMDASRTWMPRRYGAVDIAVDMAVDIAHLKDASLVSFIRVFTQNTHTCAAIHMHTRIHAHTQDTRIDAHFMFRSYVYTYTHVCRIHLSSAHICTYTHVLVYIYTHIYVHIDLLYVRVRMCILLS